MNADYFHLGAEAEAETADVTIPNSSISIGPGGSLGTGDAGGGHVTLNHLTDEWWDRFSDEATIIGSNIECGKITIGSAGLLSGVATGVSTGVPGDGSVTLKPTGNPKDAIGDTKPDLSLVPVAGLLYASHAMMDGAKKYGPYNWRENPVRQRVYIAAAQRHLAQLLDGEDIDPVSGVPHIGHALACLVILADAKETGNLVDDRPIKGPAGEMIRRFGETRSYVKEDQRAPEAGTMLLDASN